MADIYSSIAPAAEIVLKGVSYFYARRTPEGRICAISGDGRMLMLPDPETGIPGMPTADMLRAAQTGRQLFFRSEPLEDEVRAAARAECPATGEAFTDDWARLRKKVTGLWDRIPDGEKPFMSDDGLTDWLKAELGEAEIIERYGKVPCGATLRKWINTRGRKGDRRPADAGSRSGKVRRRRKIDPLGIAIIQLHAIACANKRGRSARSAHKLMKRDIAKANRGQPIMINGVEFDYDRPEHTVKGCGRTIFQREVLKARNALSDKEALGPKAPQALWKGAGPTKEPVRYLEVVEQDDTPFPIYFVVDPVRGVVCGLPTTVFSMDVFTRCFVGWDTSFDPPSHATWMRAVAHGAEPKEVPERFRGEFDGLADIYGHVGCYLYDNALQNIAKAVEDAGGDLCQEVRVAGEEQPTHKVHVERGHQTVQSLMAEAPGSSFDVSLMRKFGYDPEKHAVVTLQWWRMALAEAIATYHTTPHDGLGGRCPLDLWEEQVALHGHDQVGDLDQFIRAIGDVHYLTLDKSGVDLPYGLTYADPDIVRDLLADCASHFGTPSDTVNPSFRVKVKSFPDELGFVSIFNPLTRRLVDVPCTRRRYAAGLQLWIHLRVQDHVADKRIAFATEDQMEAAKTGLIDILSNASPQATAADRRTMMRALDSSAVQRRIGDSLRLMRVRPSPTGMENEVRHEMRMGTRRDATIEPERRQRGADSLDPRDAGKPRKANANTRTAPKRDDTGRANRPPADRVRRGARPATAAVSGKKPATARTAAAPAWKAFK